MLPTGIKHTLALYVGQCIDLPQDSFQYPGANYGNWTVYFDFTRGSIFVTFENFYTDARVRLSSLELSGFASEKPGFPTWRRRSNGRGCPLHHLRQEVCGGQDSGQFLG